MNQNVTISTWDTSQPQLQAKQNIHAQKTPVVVRRQGIIHSWEVVTIYILLSCPWPKFTSTERIKLPQSMNSSNDNPLQKKEYFPRPQIAFQNNSPRKVICSLSKRTKRGFPGGAVLKNPPANAGGTGSIPGLGRSHTPRSNKALAPQLLSLHSRVRKPQLLSPRATTAEARAPRAHAPQQEKPPQWEAHAPQRRVAPTRRN